MIAASAAELGLVSCPRCRLLTRAAGDPSSDTPLGCPRCGARLHARKPHSLRHSAAWLTAAVLLFLPANLLPVMTTSTPLSTRSDTIASGVVVLWNEGSWGLSIIVFAASILIPGLKILALGLLLVSTARGWSWRRRERTALYRVVELVGRWSMLDIFVMAVLAAMLRTRVAGVQIEPGAMAFAAVVVLTMLASSRFDPRLIWDRKEHRHA
jgi:paraquat-inducible protein A